MQPAMLPIGGCLAERMVGISPDAQRVADCMSEMCFAFARTGDPNTRAIPEWPSFDLKRRATMVFDTIPRVVDDPRGATEDADGLVNKVMQSRGYPMSDFEQRAADVSVDHPRVVENYRAAHEIAIRQRGGEATTEDLRSALIYYRSLFDDLLETSTTKKEVA